VGVRKGGERIHTPLVMKRETGNVKVD
jgi:hypothetical protein